MKSTSLNDFFGHNTLKNISDKKLLQKTKKLFSKSDSFINYGTKYKQAGLAGIFILSFRKAQNGEDFKLAAIEITKEIIGDLSKQPAKRKYQKIIRALVTMDNNNVKPEKALKFIKHHTMKNLFNGKLHDEITKNNASSKTVSNPRTTSEAIINILKRKELETDVFVILRYKGETLYSSKKSIISKFWRDNEFDYIDDEE